MMDLTTIRPLCMTPLPKPGESFRGYTLRLSEANGLETPASMLGYVGLGHLQSRLAEHPVEVIAALTGKSVLDFKMIALRSIDDPRQQLLVGHPLPKAYLRLKRPRICPECVKELGHIPARWDLMNAMVCHVHRKYLVSDCPSCHADLKWFRPGVLTCNCEASLDSGQASTKDVPESLVELTAAISAVLEGRELSDRESSTGMPFSQLTKMSLNTLLGVIHSLGARKLQLKDGVGYAKGGQEPEREFIEAAEIFSHWPKGFQQLLKLDSTAAGAALPNARKRHNSLYGRLFKMGYAEQEVSFLRRAFVEYALEYVDEAYFDRRLLRGLDVKTSSNNLRGIGAAAKELGMRPSTLRKRIAKGMYESTKISTGQITRVVIKHDHADTPLAHSEGELGLRDAGKYVQLPVSVLKELRAQEVYRAKHRTTKLTSWAIPDLKALEKELLTRCHVDSGAIPDDLVTVANVMLMKLRSDRVKAEVVIQMHQGKLGCYGKATKIPEIQVSKSAVMELADALRMEETGMCLARDVVKICGCDLGVVDGLADAGILSKQEVNGVSYFELKGVQDFNSTYVPLSVLLKDTGKSTLSALKLFKSEGIDVLEIQRKSVNSPQPFVKRSDVPKILNLVMRRDFSLMCTNRDLS